MKENKIILITMILNFIVAILKLVLGILFSFSTLLADAIQSFMDFLTDIMSLIANKVGKRRANKTYPFGYGQVYYLANLLTAFLLFLIGIFILYQFFFFEGKFVPRLEILPILLIVLILKGMVVKLLRKYGKKFKSELMIEAAKESGADFISTCVVLAVLLFAFLERFIPSYISVDKIGSLGMALYVFYISIKMIFSNVRGILTNDEENTEIKEEIMEILKGFTKLEFKKVRVIKMSTYYTLFLQVKADDKLTIKEYLVMEKKIKKQLKSQARAIRFIDIEPV